MSCSLHADSRKTKLPWDFYHYKHSNLALVPMLTRVEPFLKIVPFSPYLPVAMEFSGIVHVKMNQFVMTMIMGHTTDNHLYRCR